MKKLQSSFANMVIVLTVTASLAGFLLGYVNSATEEPRKKAEQARLEKALQSVLGEEFNVDISAPPTTLMLSDSKTAVRIYPAYDSDGKIGAAAIESRSQNGFSGEITVVTGIDVNGHILGYEVTRHNETPGLGSKMNTWFREVPSRAIRGRNIYENGLKVTKDGGDIDGITAATISSRAFLEAISLAGEGMNKYVKSLHCDSI